MKSKKVVLGACIILLLLFSLSFVSALTASIGNSRRIVRTETGDTVTGNVLVRNVNDVKVTITATVDGDLAEELKFKEENFDLAPGEEKNLEYSVRVKEEGTTETKINVGFSSEGEGGGVGLAATLIIIAKDDDDEEFNIEEIEDDEEIIEELDEEDPEITDIDGEKVKLTNKEEKFNPILLIASSTILVFVFILLLLFYLASNKPKKRLTKKNE